MNDDAPAARPLSILVADDLRDAADSLVTLLTLCGHDARAVYTGADALAAAAADPPDVVVLDLRLGDMDGLEVARRLREARAGERPRLVAMTGRATADDRERSLAVVDCHLVKPADPDVLLDVLNRLARSPGPGGVT